MLPLENTQVVPIVHYPKKISGTLLSFKLSKIELKKYAIFLLSGVISVDTSYRYSIHYPIYCFSSKSDFFLIEIFWKFYISPKKYFASCKNEKITRRPNALSFLKKKKKNWGVKSETQCFVLEQTPCTCDETRYYFGMNAYSFSKSCKLAPNERLILGALGQRL